MNFLRKELIYALVIMLTPFGFGYVISYPSPALPYFQSIWKVSEFQATAFNAVSSLTAIFGPYLTDFLLGHFGRRIVTFILAICGVVCWSLLFALKESIFWYGIIVRALLGLCMGAYSAIGPLYLVEIAPKELSGFFGSLNQLAIVFGVMIIYLLGEYRPPWTLNTLAIVTFAIQCIFIWFVPETQEPPHKLAATEVALSELEPSVVPPPPQEDVAVAVEKESLCQAKYLKNLAICIFLMIFQQFCGANAIVTNLSSLFKSANVPLRPGVAAAIAIIAQLVAVLVTGFLVDWLGRKCMWTVSCGLCSLSLLFYALNVKYQWNQYFPIIMIFLYQFGFGLALGPMPWFVVPELFPDSVRSIASAINSMMSWIGSCIVIFIYPPMLKSMGEFGTFLFFCIVAAIGAVFGLIYINEPPKQDKETEENGNVKPELEINP